METIIEKRKMLLIYPVYQINVYIGTHDKIITIFIFS